MGIGLKFRKHRIRTAEKLKDSQRFIVYIGSFFLGLFVNVLLWFFDDGGTRPMYGVIALTGGIICVYESYLNLLKKTEIARQNMIAQKRIEEDEV